MRHEEFIARIVELSTSRLEPSARHWLTAKIVYGVGATRGTRGTCYYRTWKNGQPEPIPLVEICAAHEESLVQVAGTTVHELGHVLAGPTAGHNDDWKSACRLLGLNAAKAAGMRYTLSALAPAIREYVVQVSLTDGQPLLSQHFGLTAPRPCGLGIGTRGGKSRGTGSGSRLRRWICECNPPIIARVASDDFAATCDHCGRSFHV